MPGDAGVGEEGFRDRPHQRRHGPRGGGRAVDARACRSLMNAPLRSRHLLLGKAAKLRSVVRPNDSDPDRTIAIGDEVRDIEAARAVGLATGAVGWGYATLALLRAQQPDHLFSSIDEMRRTLVD
ncbi:MAG: HAD hydrolase-like protein [Hyphomicrobiales bacterium]|nr:HAD hydrolase-like protein [Hyphomicrobiales bacterium]